MLRFRGIGSPPLSSFFEIFKIFEKVIKMRPEVFIRTFTSSENDTHLAEEKSISIRKLWKNHEPVPRQIA